VVLKKMVLKKMKMDDQSLGDPMKDGRSMVFLKRGAKMDDHLMVDRYCVDALPWLLPRY
jgi:hypothetical protein